MDNFIHLTGDSWNFWSPFPPTVTSWLIDVMGQLSRAGSSPAAAEHRAMPQWRRSAQARRWTLDADQSGVMEHYVRREPIPYESEPVPDPRRWFQRMTFRDLLRGLRGLLHDRNPSPYSSVSPRRMDGSYTRIFPFNSSRGGVGGGL